MAVAVSVATMFPVASADGLALNFYEYLLGDWEVVKSTALFGTSDITAHPVRGYYHFDKDNATALAIVGSYYENDTESGVIGTRLSVRIDFDDPASGVFKTAHEDTDAETDADTDSEGGAELFRFAFESSFAGVSLAVGEWRGADPSVYTITIAAADKFTIQVIPTALTPTAPATDGDADESDDGRRATIYTLRKAVPPAAKSLFQQYGMYGMLVVFFIVNMYIKSRTGGAAATTTTPAATAVATKKNK